MLSVDHLEDWDSSIFRMPRTDKCTETTVNERVKTLELQFAGEDGKCDQRINSTALLRSLTEKVDFIKELTSLENVRTVDQYIYNKSLGEKKERASAKPTDKAIEKGKKRAS